MEVSHNTKNTVVKLATILLIAITAVCVFGFIDYHRPKKPFANLASSDIDHITIEFGIHNYELSDEEQTFFIDLLKETVIYGKDNSWTEYVGLGGDFETVFKKDGTSFDVNYSYPFVFIDGQGYKGEQKPCVDIQNYIHDIYLYQFYGKRE